MGHGGKIEFKRNIPVEFFFQHFEKSADGLKSTLRFHKLANFTLFEALFHLRAIDDFKFQLAKQFNALFDFVE